ncbi:MAG: threonylcarbamoyl-AMP synthase [Synergistetes bacterium]|nr:MAG: Sua5/YciO/YrdC/YwlC family protein [bacterium 42_11]MBC7332449.1 threonylcarbamoyl-AMP synthase [Synergistota bacterium]
MTRIVEATEEGLKIAALIIKRGGLVAFPTETVYGLGADALNPEAVAKIFEAKERPFFDPLIVHIADVKELDLLWLYIDDRAKALIERFWPGPLTIVLPKKDIVPDIVTAGLNTVAVRMPSHPVALRLIRESETPIAAPSANRFGYLSPTMPEHVLKQLGGRIDLIIDGGRTPVGVESTIIDLSEETPLLLRPGGLPVEEIERVIGKVKMLTESEKPRSPGQLPRHYSPRTPLRIIEDENFEVPFGIKAGLLAFKEAKYREKFFAVEVLSPSGDLKEAACNLFPCLHRLDDAGLDIIYAEAIPEEGLGRAIMDRLRKAQAKR